MSELARGRVADRPWGLTLGALGVRGLTGIVRLTSESKLFSIRFEGGAVVDATSTVIADSAPRVAMTADLITSAEVGEIVRQLALAPDRDELEVVAEVAKLTPEATDQLRRRLIAQRTARTLSVTDGEFVISTASHLRSVTALDIRPLIYLGALVHLPAVRLEADLAGIGARFRLKEDADAELPAYGFTPAEGRVVARLQDGATLAELEEAYPDLERRTISAVVYALVSGLACHAVEDVAIPLLSRTDTRRVVSKVDSNTTFTVRVKTAPAQAAQPEPPAAPPPKPPAAITIGRTRKVLDTKTPPIIERRAPARAKKPSIPGQRGMAIVERKAPHIRDPRTATAPHAAVDPFDDIDLARKSGVHAAIRPPTGEAEPLAGSPFDDIDLARRSAEMRAAVPEGSISEEIEAAFEDVASKSGRHGRVSQPPPLGEPGFDATALDPNADGLDEPTVPAELDEEAPTGVAAVERADTEIGDSEEPTGVVITDARPPELDDEEPTGVSLDTEDPTATVEPEQPAIAAGSDDSEERTAVSLLAVELSEARAAAAEQAARRRTAAMWAQAPFDADPQHEQLEQRPATSAPRPRTRTEQLLVFAAIPREPAKRDLPTDQQEPLQLDTGGRKPRAETSPAWLPLGLRAPAKRGRDE